MNHGVGAVWTYAAELARGLEDCGVVEILLVSSGGLLTDAQWAVVDVLQRVRFVETRFKFEWMNDS